MFDVTCENIASGNWRSMKSEIEGKILSDVKGVSDVSAAVAKELKATRTRRCVSWCAEEDCV